MHPEEIEKIIATHLSCYKVEVTGDGHHFDALIVSNEFENKSLLQRQRHVYQYLDQWIKTGELHAISMKTFTVKEYQPNS